MGNPPPHLNKHNNQLMVNWWVWVGGLGPGGLDSSHSLLKSMCYFARIPDHQPKPPIYHYLEREQKKHILESCFRKQPILWSPQLIVTAGCGTWGGFLGLGKKTRWARGFMLCSKMGNLICVKKDKIEKRNKQKWMLFPRTMINSAN